MEINDNNRNLSPLKFVSA